MSDDRKDLPPVTAPNFNERLREILQTYLGTRGNKLDRGITLRDLSEAGVIKLRPGYAGGTSGSSASPVAGPGLAVVGAYEPDLTPPPAPDGFMASAAISHLFIEHAAPIYPQGHGHARTVVYGATWTGGALPTFSDAVKLTEFTGTVFAHPTNPATTWHLWIKWQSVDGVLSAPAGGTNGKVAITGQNVAQLLQALSGQITASQLYTDLGARIDLIDGPDTLAGSVAQRLLDEVNARATLLNDYYTKVGADSAIATNATYLRAYANLTSTAFRQATAPTQRGTDLQTAAAVPLRTGDTWIDTDDNKLYQWSGSAWVYSPDGAIATVDARVTSVETTKIGYCSIDGAASDHTTKTTCETAGGVWNVGLTLATAVKQVYISDGVTSGTIQQKATALKASTGALELQYTVKVDVNGYVAGYGLASTLRNGVPSSEFVIRADTFAIAPINTDNTANDGSPFFYRTVATTINGVSVPAGAHLKAAFIHDAAITNAKIANLAVDDAKIANLSVSKLEAGSLKVGAYISSANYVAGSQGFAIWATGLAEFNNVVVRGTVYASAGSFTGTVYANAGELRGLTIKNAAGEVILSSGGTPPARWLNSNILSTDSWTTGHGGAPGYNRNGGFYEQYRASVDLPDKSRGMAWICYPGLYNGQYAEGVPAGDADGGWQTDPFPVNADKTYRFVVFFQRNGPTAGSTYLGCQGGTVREMGNGAVNGNPYFWSGGALTIGRWYMAVGYVYPASFAYSAQDNKGGVWDCVTGAKVSDGTDYAWVAGVTASIHRAYLYYSVAGAQQYLAGPRVEVCDGTEPSLDALLSMSALSGRNPITQGNASTYIAQAAIGSAYIRDLDADKIKVGVLTGHTLNAAILNGATGIFSGSLTAGVLDPTTMTGVTTSYTSPGAFTLTVPAGKTTMRILLIGAGGGGGGGNWRGYGTIPGGGGGGGGAVQLTVPNLSPGASYTLVVGSGGNAGYPRDGSYSAGASGTPGGGTYIGGIAGASAGGGGAGLVSPHYGGTPTGGASGGLYATGGTSESAGGKSLRGAGGNPGYGGVAPTPGQYGSGGGGGDSQGSMGGLSQGAGTFPSYGGHGVAVIEFYNPNQVVLRDEYAGLTAALSRQGLQII